MYVRRMPHIVDHHGAAGAGRFREHKMIQQQLSSAGEQVEQADFAVGTGERVGLGHLGHRQAAALGVEGVAGTGVRFLFYAKGLQGLLPFLFGYDPVHCGLRG